MKHGKLTRRGFVKAAAGVGGVALARAARPALGALGANERIVLASIGVGGQGTAHLHDLIKMQDVKVAAVCDVDQSHLDAAAKLVGNGVQTTKDFREVLDMKEVDAVLIAPPGHWHGPAAVWACRAGKDVYVEKPICHNIREGRILTDTAAEHKRVVQVGMQQRTTPHWINAVNRMKAGEIGKINMVHVWNAWTPQEMFGSIGHVEDSDTPAGVDYDMWLGPTPKRPFNRLRFHQTHYFFWDYGGGMMSDWGIHLFDVVAWTMGPKLNAVSTIGGMHVFKDDRQTPDTAVATFDCPGYTMYYNMRHGNGWQPHGQMDHGIQFYGEGGTLDINRNGFQMYHDTNRDTRKPFYEEKGSTELWEHKRNFFDCIRSRKQTEAHAEAGHQSAVFGHLANISYRVGRRLQWDGQKETIVNDAAATKLLGREHYRDPWRI